MYKAYKDGVFELPTIAGQKNVRNASNTAMTQ